MWSGKRSDLVVLLLLLGELRGSEAGAFRVAPHLHVVVAETLVQQRHQYGHEDGDGDDAGEDGQDRVLRAPLLLATYPANSEEQELIKRAYPSKSGAYHGGVRDL